MTFVWTVSKLIVYINQVFVKKYGGKAKDRKLKFLKYRCVYSLHDVARVYKMYGAKRHVNSLMK